MSTSASLSQIVALGGSTIWLHRGASVAMNAVGSFPRPFGQARQRRGNGRVPDDYREVLGSGLEECVRLGRMVESLLFLARAENPRTEIVREKLALRRELVTVAEFYEAAASEAGVRLAVDADEKLTVVVNRPLFQRAVGNLVGNALAHTPPGGSVTVSARVEGDEVVVEIVDTGRGIPPEHLPHVFERFYRADPVRSSTGGNLGLGLAIVKSIAELHGGKVEITSRVGGGTTVALHLPVSALFRMTKT